MRGGGGFLALLLAMSVSVIVATCPACLVRQELRSISLSAIKQQILAKLGMSRVPNITGRPLPRIPPLKDLWDVYPVQGDEPPQFRPGPTLLEEADDYTATIEKVIAFAQPHPKMRHGRGPDFLSFKFSDKVEQNRVVRAHLWLYLRPTLSDESYSISITVNKIPRVQGTDSTSFSTSRPSQNTLIAFHKETRPRGARGRWISIECRKLVADWFKIPKENMGIMVTATAPGQEVHTQHLVVTSPDHGEPSFMPFLEVHITDARKHRTKRTLGLNCQENSNETKCCRYPLTVDFEEFGWDWIIAPKKYDANYCAGDCPPVFLPKYTHTHLVHMASPEAAGPCCAPRKMSSISMLYFNEDFNIIYGLLPGMVVDRCGCS